MAEGGALATWLALAFGAWAFAGGLASTPARPAFRDSALRALMASGAAAATAAALLATLLVQQALTVTYVARTIARNVPAPYRLGALWSLPSGSVLPAAALCAVFVAIACRRSRSPLGVAAGGATIVALLAASVAAAPFAILPWIPADGLGMIAGHQHPAAIAARGALGVAVAACTAALAVTAEPLGDTTTPPHDGRRATGWLLLAAAALGATAFLGWTGAPAGLPMPPALWHGALVPPIVAVGLALMSRGGTRYTPLLSALGATALSAGVLLSGGRPGHGMHSTFAIAALGAAAAGAAGSVMLRHPGWHGAARVAALGALAAGAAVVVLAGSDATGSLTPAAFWLLIGGGVVHGLAVAAGTSTPLRIGAGVALTAAGGVVGWLASGGVQLAAGWGALAGASVAPLLLPFVARHTHAAGVCEEPAPGRPRLAGALLRGAVVLAALGMGAATTGEERTLTLASGADSTFAVRGVGMLRLAHQGVSRYEAANAHVVAVALEGRVVRDDDGGGTVGTLVAAERREYVNSRDEPLGDAEARPGIFGHRLGRVSLRLLGVDADDGATVHLTVLPLAGVWGWVLALLALAAVLSIAPPPDRGRISPSVADGVG